jgi:hypothetical protein
MTRPNCATCAHRTGVKSCGYLLGEGKGTVWCDLITECDQHQAKSIPLHVSALTAIAKRGDRAGWREYIDTVRSAEGAASAEQLKAALIAAWGTK